MKNTNLLSIGSEFVGYQILAKLSVNHDGEREVYMVKSADGKTAAMTVFNMAAQRYVQEEKKGAEASCNPEDIEEVKFLRNYADQGGLPRMLDCGVSKMEERTLAWTASEWINGSTMEEQISLNRMMPLKDTLEVMNTVCGVLERISRHTQGGGHYNISPTNVMLDYDDNSNLNAVYVTGFSNMGPTSSGLAKVDEDSLDYRLRAPETLKGIYTNRSDIFSLGTMMLMMLAGEPPLIETEGFKVRPAGSANPDNIAPADYQKALWKHAQDELSQPLRLMLRKATDTSPYSRFSSIDKFRSFLDKYASSNIARKDEKPLSGSTKSAGAVLAAPDEEYVEKTETADNKIRQGKPAGNAGGLEDVAGMAELKALFRRDFIRIVRNPKVAKAYGIKPSNCTLLYGPQGCGKTFIAEKAAQESGLKYKIVNPAELGSVYIHGSQQKIAELFDEAEKKGPMILIFDEFDALVPKRDGDINPNQANEVNEMLTQLNNCASRGIYVLATTNRPTLIDPAVLRSGRVERKIYVSLPDKEARTELFRLELTKRPCDGMDYDVLGAATENYTCSDISFIVEEAARTCFEETLDRGLDTPLPLTMDRVMEIIKTTQPSVSEEQRKEYQELRSKMENRNSSRKKVGYSTAD